jgi:hypothetical protein
VPVIRSALGDAVDDSSRATAKLGLVIRSQHLKLEDRILIELLCRSAVHFVPIRHPVDQNIGIIRALAQNRGTVIINFGYDSIDRDSRTSRLRKRVAVPQTLLENLQQHPINADSLHRYGNCCAVLDCPSGR